MLRSPGAGAADGGGAALPCSRAGGQDAGATALVLLVAAALPSLAAALGATMSLLLVAAALPSPAAALGAMAPVLLAGALGVTHFMDFARL